MKFSLFTVAVLQAATVSGVMLDYQPQTGAETVLSEYLDQLAQTHSVSHGKQDVVIEVEHAGAETPCAAKKKAHAAHAAHKPVPVPVPVHKPVPVPVHVPVPVKVEDNKSKHEAAKAKAEAASAKADGEKLKSATSAAHEHAKQSDAKAAAAHG